MNASEISWPIKIVISPAELAFVYTLAAQRFSCKPEIDRFLANNLSAYGSHVLGIMGEFSVAKIFKCKIDQNIYRNGDKHRADIFINNVPIEIKTITYNGKDKMLKLTSDEINAEISYILAHVQWPDTITVFPPIKGNIIKIISKEVDFGYGKRFTVTDEQILKNNERG